MTRHIPHKPRKCGRCGRHYAFQPCPSGKRVIAGDPYRRRLEREYPAEANAAV